METRGRKPGSAPGKLKPTNELSQNLKTVADRNWRKTLSEDELKLEKWPMLTEIICST